MDLYPLIVLAAGTTAIGLSLLALRKTGRLVRNRGRRARAGLGLAGLGVEAAFLVFVLLLASGPLFPAVLLPGMLNRIWIELCLAAGLLGALTILGRTWGSPSTSEVGLRVATGEHTLIDLGFGFALGASSVGLFPIVGALGGWDRMTGVSGTLDLLAALGLGAVFCIATALFEEVLYRGCLFSYMSKLIGTRIALILSLLIFGLLHGLNTGGSVLAVASVLVAAVVLTLGLWRTGALWLSIGFHTSWNWVLSSIFGYSVSGIRLASAVQRQVDPSAPVWATGGAFGPEASVFGILAFGLAGVAVWLYTQKQFHSESRPDIGRT